MLELWASCLSRIGALGRNALHVMVWNGARIIVQLVWLLLITRVLGPEGYGLIAGLIGFALAVGGLVGFGMGMLMYRDTARDAALFHLRWRQTWVLGWLSGALFSIVFVTMGLWLYPGVPVVLFALIAGSELLAYPLIAHVGLAFSAHDRMGYATAMPVLLAVARVLAVLAFEWLDVTKNAVLYGWFHLGATVVATSVSVILLRRVLVPVHRSMAVDWLELRAGIGFSAVSISGIALVTADKAIVLRWGGAEVTGHYSIAQRLALVAAMPVDALVAAALPRLFRNVSSSDNHSALLKTLFVAVLSYGLLAGSLVWVGADALPWLLGNDFQLAGAAVKGVAIYVPLYCLRILISNLLLTIGLKLWRFGIECAGVGCLAVLCLLWVPVFGLSGAVAVLVVTEMGILIAESVIFVLKRRDKSGGYA